MKNIFYALVIVSSLLTSCVSDDGDKVTMGEVCYIKSFPHSAILSKITGSRCEEIGLRGVRHIDSLLILSHDKFWTILSDDAKTSYGKCLSFGSGPNEFIYTPRCGAAAYRTEDDSLIAYICDKDRGNYCDLTYQSLFLPGKII